MGRLCGTCDRCRTKLGIADRGESTTGGACLLGGIAGGFGAGWLGYVSGQWAGEASHDFATEWLWIRQCGWIERINRAILRRVSPTPSLVAHPEGIELGDGSRYRYADLQRVVAFRHPGLVGDALSVALDFGDEHVVVVSQTDDAWSQVVSALDADPRSRMPSPQWSLALIAGEGESQLEILGLS